MDNPETRRELLALTSKIVTAHLSANSVAPDDLPGMINGVYGALANTIAPAEPPAAPAVSIKKSVTLKHIACLEDGKKFKMLAKAAGLGKPRPKGRNKPKRKSARRA